MSLFSALESFRSKCLALAAEVKSFTGNRAHVKFESLRLRITDLQAELMSFNPEEATHLSEKEQLIDKCKSLHTELTLQSNNLSTLLEQEMLAAEGNSEQNAKDLQELFRKAVGK